MSGLVSRPRRLRRTPAMRRLVAQTRLSASDLVLPLFVKEGISEPAPIASMPGVVQHTRDSVRKAAAEAVADGVGGLILFGIPAHKDARGTGADDPAGIVQLALRDLVGEVGDATVLMADLCLDEYTDHGHCGVVVESACRRVHDRQRCDSGAVRIDRCCSSDRRNSRRRTERHDGRPGCRDSRRS